MFRQQIAVYVPDCASGHVDPRIRAEINSKPQELDQISGRSTRHKLKGRAERRPLQHTEFHQERESSL